MRLHRLVLPHPQGSGNGRAWHLDERSWHPAGWIARLPQEDFCQAKGVASGQKYEQTGGAGIEACLAVLKGGEAFHEDGRNFLIAQLLFWLLAAIDGHAKNFSLFVLPGGR